MGRVTDAQVAAHRPRVEQLADRLGRRPRVERDDLVQEGLISVWLSLEQGEEPTDGRIAGRMKNWIRMENRQRTGVPNPTLDDEHLPLEVADAAAVGS